MNTTRRRPEAIRCALLDQTARLLGDQGIGIVTHEAVAAAAGVSKGALLHHFPTKQSFLDETVANLLKRVDAEIDALLASDSIPYGRFTRAYVQAAFGGVTSGLDAVTSKLLMAVITGPSLRHHWSRWLDARLDYHRSTDCDANLHVVRWAADGAWLSCMLDTTNGASLDLDAIKERLLEMARPGSSRPRLAQAAG